MKYLLNKENTLVGEIYIRLKEGYRNVKLIKSIQQTTRELELNEENIQKRAIHPLLVIQYFSVGL